MRLLLRIWVLSRTVLGRRIGRGKCIRTDTHQNVVCELSRAFDVVAFVIRVVDVADGQWLVGLRTYQC